MRQALIIMNAIPAAWASRSRPSGLGARARAAALALVVCLALAALAAGSEPPSAARPPAPQLLPKNTVLLLRIRDAKALVSGFRQTGLGRALNDPQVLPFFQHVYDSFRQEFQRAEQRLGLPLDQLLGIPQGEACLALVAPEEGRPALVVLVDAGDRIADARRLVERLQQELERRGAVLLNEEAGDARIVVAERGGTRRRQVVFFDKAGTIGLTTNADLARALLEVWQGAEAPTLADNPEYAELASRWSAPRGQAPDLSMFVDPIGLFESATEGNAGAQMALLMLGPLGLDGVRAVGGALTYGDHQFAEIAHLDVLLASPRRAVLDLLAPKSGEATPEVWAPEDVSGYMTLHWDFAHTVNRFEHLYDTFAGEGAFARQLEENVSQRLGVDVRTEVLDSLADRITMMTWLEPPARWNSQCTLVGVQLQDARRFNATLNRILERLGGRAVKKTYGGVSYYALPAGRAPGNPRLVRQPQPAVTLLGDYLIVTDSERLLARAIDTRQGRHPALRDNLEYKLMVSQVGRQAGGAQPCLFSFSRPEESLRALYELLRTGELRQWLAERRADNVLFRALHDAMVERPLPPFDVCSKYFAPQGAFMVNDGSGLHLRGFTLRR